MNRQDRILAIVLAAEHLADLPAVDQSGELLHSAGQLGADVLSLSRPFDEDGKIVGLSPEGIDQLDFLFEPAAALENSLRFGLIAPEIGSRGLNFYLSELLGRMCGVKDSSADRQRVLRGPDISG